MCCFFLFSDSEEAKKPEHKYRIKGTTVDLHPYQLLGVFKMFEMENFQNGGYNADDCGLGKVRQLVDASRSRDSANRGHRPLKSCALSP